MSDLGPAVQTVIHRCLAVQAGEDVVVVVDRATRTIGEALRDEAAATGADAVLTIMD
jgi:leucyl aminopeptidase (aminopeptidase T)